MAGALSNLNWGNALQALGAGLLTAGAPAEQRSAIGIRALGDFNDMLANQKRQKERDILLNMQISENARANQERAEAMKRQQDAISSLPSNLQKLAQADPNLIGSYGESLLPKQTTPGQIKWEKVREGNEDVTYQINPDGTYKEIARGAAWAPTMSQPPEAPSSVREWQYFNTLPPDQQQQYLVMKRAADWQNLGGSMTLPNPLNPAGAPVASMPKTLPPEDVPGVRQQQAYATETGKNQAEAEALSAKKGREAATSLDVLTGVEDLIDKSTGSYSGAARDMIAGVFGGATEGAKANAQLKVIQAKLMTSMPRMEGPQSDRDVQLYREAAGQIGDPTVPNEIKKAAVKTIRELQTKYPGSSSGASAPSKAPDPLGIRP